jgi:hypothetical protein
MEPSAFPTTDQRCSRVGKRFLREEAASRSPERLCSIVAGKAFIIGPDETLLHAEKGFDIVFPEGNMFAFLLLHARNLLLDGAVLTNWRTPDRYPLRENKARK